MDYLLTLTSRLSGSGGKSPPVHSGVAVLPSCSRTWRVKALIIPFSIFKLMSEPAGCAGARHHARLAETKQIKREEEAAVEVEPYLWVGAACRAWSMMMTKDDTDLRTGVFSTSRLHGDVRAFGFLLVVLSSFRRSKLAVSALRVTLLLPHSFILLAPPQPHPELTAPAPVTSILCFPFLRPRSAAPQRPRTGTPSPAPPPPPRSEVLLLDFLSRYESRWGLMEDR